ncbi:MAG: hypothetical protein ACI9ON_001869 [Limisphaerales bacterium]|jgi:hypothetical protein
MKLCRQRGVILEFFGTFFRGVFLWTFLAVFLALPAAAEFNGRVVAVGDVHGAFAEFSGLLKDIEIIDDEGHWIGGETQLVSLGDLLDRGPESRLVMDLLRRLEVEAPKEGGRVHVVLGNHELMNLTWDVRDVSEAEFAALGGRPGHRAAFSTGGEYGQWLLSKSAVLKIGDTLFLHGGLSTSFSSVEEVNRTIADRLAEIVAVGERWMVDGQLDGTVSLMSLVPGETLAANDKFFSAIGDPLLADYGPAWYRGNALCHPLIESYPLSQTLARLKVARVVMGHTPTTTREIVHRFNGKAWLIDTGMLQEVYRGNARALEIQSLQAGVTIKSLPEATASTLDIDQLMQSRRQRIQTLTATGEISELDTTLQVRLDNKVVAVEFQPLRKKQAQRALAALRLDQWMGLGMVLPGAIREFRGELGWLQQAVRSVAEQDRDFAFASFCEAGTSNGNEYDLLSVFDSLIGQRNRDGVSLRYHLPARSLVLTQNHLAFSRRAGLPKYGKHPNLAAGLAAKLVSLDRTVLNELLGDLLKPAQIKAILTRRDKILEWREPEL